MKRWAFLTVLIYAFALVLLAVPVIVIAFSGKHLFSIKQAATVYRECAYWLWVVVLVGGQALLLLLPINVAEKRLPARRNLKIPVIVGGFFSACWPWPACFPCFAPFMATISRITMI